MFLDDIFDLTIRSFLVRTYIFYINMWCNCKYLMGLCLEQSFLIITVVTILHLFLLFVLYAILY